MPTTGDAAVGDVVSVRVENVGGIDETRVDFGPGVTVLCGRNATNRTSFLTAIAAVLGDDSASLKADADSGRVELTVDGATYTRQFERAAGTVTTSGDPYCSDATLASLFAVLLETNEARRAVERIDEGAAGDLRDVLMQPVDTDRIEAEIDRLQTERASVDEELDRLDDLQSTLPDLERRRSELDRQIDETRRDLQEVREEISTIDGSDSDDERVAAELEERLAELRTAQSSLEDARFDLETALESVSELRSDRSEIEATLDDLETVSSERLETLTERIGSLRSRRSKLESEINELQSVVGFNESMLAERTSVFAQEETEQDVSERLLEEDRSVSCWTCGSTVSVEELEATVDHLRSRRQRKIDERSSLGEEIDEHEAERSELERRQRRRSELQRKLDDVESEIRRLEDQLAQHRETVREREAGVEELETAVSELEAAEADDEVLIEHHREAQALTDECDRLEDERGDVRERIAELESELARHEALTSRREELTDQIQECRTRVDRIEESAVQAFNDHVEEVLGVLDYDNVERVWLERTTESVREGRRTVERRSFEHHVARVSDDGSTYEDRVENLSESEREVIGLVVALAGFLVHDVHESVPFVLLDSLEAIDADRIAALVDYFQQYADHLLVALLPEDAQALNDDYEYVTDI